MDTLLSCDKGYDNMNICYIVDEREVIAYEQL